MAKEIIKKNKNFAKKNNTPNHKTTSEKNKYQTTYNLFSIYKNTEICVWLRQPTLAGATNKHLPKTHGVNKIVNLHGNHCDNGQNDYGMQIYHVSPL